jgi:hypothetical protein
VDYVILFLKYLAEFALDDTAQERHSFATPIFY